MKKFNNIKDIWKYIDRLIPKTLFRLIHIIYDKIIYFYFSGDNYICPCCGGHYRKLRSYGVGNTPNRCCPIDKSLERHRLVWVYLIKETKFFSENLRALHFAPQKCFQDYFTKKSNLEYITADLHSSDMMIQMDITDIIYEDDYFDIIFCLHILEHVLDDKKAMTEMFRVLKPGGLIIIQTPIDKNLDETFEDSKVIKPEDRRRLFGQEDHVRIYGKDLKIRLENVGFSVEVENYAKTLGIDFIKRYRLRMEDIYLCKKPV